MGIAGRLPGFGLQLYLQFPDVLWAVPEINVCLTVLSSEFDFRNWRKFLRESILQTGKLKQERSIG